MALHELGTLATSQFYFTPELVWGINVHWDAHTLTKVASAQEILLQKHAATSAH